MNIDEITARLEASYSTHHSTARETTELTMLALATYARQQWPKAVYVECTVTDQDMSGNLWEVAVCDADEDQIPGSESIGDLNVAANLDDSNKSVWLPFMTPGAGPDKYRSTYLLIIDSVLTADIPQRAESEPVDEVAQFLAEYARWSAYRTALSEAEENGEKVKAGDWEGSDDTAVDLLRNAAKLLGAPDDS